jgi:hypothetical protein
MIALVVIEPPVLMVSVPLTVGDVFTVKAPLTVKLLKVVAPPPRVPEPAKATVPEPIPALKVPLFVKDPPFAMVMVKFPRFTVEPDANV